MSLADLTITGTSGEIGIADLDSDSVSGTLTVSATNGNLGLGTNTSVDANFDISDKTNYTSLDITFIPSLILDMAGLNHNEFYKASSLIRKNCNGQINTCANKNKNIDNMLESYKTLISKQLGF